jgi:hypothetical protein
MPKITVPTIYANKEWFEYLKEHSLGSAGPNPSITGMKRLFYGMDAYCVMCNHYLFNVTSLTYDTIKNAEVYRNL